MKKQLIHRITEFSKLLFQNNEEFNGRCFHLSFILHGSKILSYAQNTYDHHHLEHKFGVYKDSRCNHSYQSGRHSEAEVIKKFENMIRFPEWKKYTLVNVRVDNNGKLNYAAPCNNCWFNLIEPRGFRRIYFSNNKETFVRI